MSQSQNVPAPPHLSLVVPAYNEAERLPISLLKIADYLGRQDYRSEVIIVDDGSTDETPAVAARFVEKYGGRLLISEHSGKGCAVTAGMLAAQGKYVIFSDADLSTPVQTIERVLQRLDWDCDVVVGSRELKGSRRYGEPIGRHLMGRAFNWFQQMLLGTGVKDTQCGFKGFRGVAAHDIFSRLLLYGQNCHVVRGPMVTAFDVEVLFVARKLGYSICEIPVEWHYSEGSKVNPLVDSIRMASDVVRVKLNEAHYLYERKPIRKTGDLING